MPPEAEMLNKSPLPTGHREALTYIMRAWAAALDDGLEPDLLANAALFAALSDLVSGYGEDAVSRLVEGLSARVQRGEFTVISETLQ